MKETRILMGMPIELELVDGSQALLEETFAYFAAVEEQFSVYKETSEISRFNRGEILGTDLSVEVQEVFAIGERTKRETGGYFDICRPDGRIDPSGVVKGWAIRNAAARVRAAGSEHFILNVGGDIATGGKNAEGGEWSVGVRNPFNLQEVVKVVYPRGKGVATSGSYIRGAHIYNPLEPGETLDQVLSITIVGPDVLAADLLATAAFAMGKQGIAYVESREGYEGYAIDASGTATATSGFAAYTRA